MADKQIVLDDNVKSMLTKKTQEYKLKHRYNLTLDHYNQLLYEQGFKCKICEKSVRDVDGPLAVDHDHNTGEIRGLLCSGCNTGIGLLKEDPTILAKAIIYLTNSNDN